MITINEFAVSHLMSYVEKVNKRAVKLGFDGLTVVEIGRRLVARPQSEYSLAEPVYDVMIDFEVTGNTPKIEGWDFIARIEHDPTIGNILKVAPGMSLPKEFWDAPCNCEHCGTKRVRKDTFILRNASGEYKQIGRQCVRDFIGYDNPNDMYWWVGISGSIEEEMREYHNGAKFPETYSLTTAVARSLAVIDQFGYVSRKMANENPDKYAVTTGGLLSDTYKNPSYYTKYDHEWIPVVLAGAGDKLSKAEEIISWINSWDEVTRSSSEFNHNVYAMVSSGLCRMKDFGIVACLPTLYARHTESIRVAADRANKVNEHVGVIGDKITVEVSVYAVIVLSGAYGTTYLTMMEDADGRCYKWNSSRQVLSQGDRVKLIGTVKGHDEYKGRNQTSLTRCKVI